MYNVFIGADFMREKIQRFQEYLSLIRKSVGWSEAEFGNRIGVTRQTINNLETRKSQLTQTQYLAMRAVLSDEIISSINNTDDINDFEKTKDIDMLVCLLESIIDNPEKYSTEERNNILDKAKLLTPAIMTKNNSRKEVSNEYINILKAVGVMAGGIVLAGLSRYFFKGKK